MDGQTNPKLYAPSTFPKWGYKHINKHIETSISSIKPAAQHLDSNQPFYHCCTINLISKNDRFFLHRQCLSYPHFKNLCFLQYEILHRDVVHVYFCLFEDVTGYRVLRQASIIVLHSDSSFLLRNSIETNTTSN